MLGQTRTNVRAFRVSLMIVTIVACAKAETEPTKLALDLPSGVAVTVDEQPVSERVLEVTPGEHTVGIVTPCGTHRATVRVEAQHMTESFPHFGRATLVLQVSAPPKEKPNPTALRAANSHSATVERRFPSHRQ